MTTEQGLVFLILALALGMFLWGRWRHDMVALGALVAAVAVGVVPADAAFVGFGHPAVITVACVLILSRGLQNSGAVDLLAQRLLPMGAPPVVLLSVIIALTALLSGFMNNVGALALTMPLALQAAARSGWPPGVMLMPLAFGSILGGMTTLIGTPPNLIVSGFRQEALGTPFRMFDFLPVGLAVAAAGVVFLSLIGWRLVPNRKRVDLNDFKAGAYLTEARVPPTAKAVGLTLREIEERLEEAHAQVLGLVRQEVQLRAPSMHTRVRAEDILILEAEPEGVASALAALGIKLEEDVDVDALGQHPGADERGAATEPPEEPAEAARGTGGDADIVLSELVVSPLAPIIRRTATELNLRRRYHINLLAVSRRGRHAIGRLKRTRFEAGDVLLLQGAPEAVKDFAADHGLLPLADRSLRIPDRKSIIFAVSIFVLAVALAAFEVLPAAVAFAAGVLAVMVTRVVPPRSVYAAVDWSIIVLLASLIPVAEALASTGAAELVAGLLVETVSAAGLPMILAALLVLTMTLSDMMNNAATVAIMSPIALAAAGASGGNPDAFLMAVAIGGSCSFLTPIGHQNNTLILGPGGFRFGDYWRLGLPLELLVLAVSLPMIAIVWGL